MGREDEVRASRGNQNVWEKTDGPGSLAVMVQHMVLLCSPCSAWSSEAENFQDFTAISLLNFGGSDAQGQQETLAGAG